MADRYTYMTTAELEDEASSRQPAVDLSDASTNDERRELLRKADGDGQVTDTEAATEPTTTPSIGVGPHGEFEGTDSGARPEQARTSQLASSEEEMDERAEYIASTHVATVAPARAREEAEAARRRAGASDPEQSKVELAIATKLEEIADRYDAQQRVQSERSRIQNRGASPQALSGTGSGPLGEPLPDGVKRGEAVVYHTPGELMDTTGLVINIWPPVADNPDEPDGPSNRWRADLAVFPLRGSPSTLEGIAYGSGTGQFELASDLEEDARGLPEGTEMPQTPFRHEIA